MINNFNINNFLKDYWQKKPLLIRAAFPDFQTPISAEELAGLACEEFIESRIIIENVSNENDATEKWILENGPFPESRFSNLPDSHWTLLIQGLNKIIPEFDDLLHQFDFIPSWRVDDVMASYAVPNGSVGPHTDQYDVFLLQATGRRKWMINENPVEKGNYEKNIPLKIIKQFTGESEWILEAGDMLYLPANVAHYGIGMDDCMTFSIGFRAPSYSEIITSYIDDHITEFKDDMRYQDPHLTDDINNGEITSSAIDNIQKILLSQFTNKSNIEDWFGRFITDYLNDNDELTENTLSSEDFLETFKKLKVIRRLATVRANFLIQKNGTLSLFINGNKQDIPPDTTSIAKLICNQHLINYDDFKTYLNDNNSIKFLCSLYNKGYMVFSNE